MSSTFKPHPVPSEVIARWPAMALALWKRSFQQQAAILLAGAMLVKLLPALSAPLGFLLAPSLFVVAFCAVQMADEHAAGSWTRLLREAMPGALRVGAISLRFAAGFGALFGALWWLVESLLPLAPQPMDERALPAASDALLVGALPLEMQFLHFCASWTSGIMTMMFLGLFIVAIYQGVFGVILHAQQGLDARSSRRYAWRAWQVNAPALEEALHCASPAAIRMLVAAVLAVACAFQSVYLSPVGLLLATYVPCLAYVAYRSIFFGQHENVPAAQRTAAADAGPQALPV